MECRFVELIELSHQQVLLIPQKSTREQTLVLPPPPRLLSQAAATFSECPPEEGWSHERSVDVFISVFVF